MYWSLLNAFTLCVEVELELKETPLLKRGDLAFHCGWCHVILSFQSQETPKHYKTLEDGLFH